MADFRIETTRNNLYLDKGGQPINGYTIRVRLFKWDEIIDLNVPSLDPVVVSQAIQDLMAQREALHNLGGA